MKLISIASIAHYVKDLDKTADFYEKLGFIIYKREDNFLIIRLNWFMIKFIVDDKEVEPSIRKEADEPKKGMGTFTCVNVDAVDEYYENLLAKGFKPESKPRDMKSGNREFILRDPDGYKLVFFQKK